MWILLTGATGKLGIRLALALLERSFKVLLTSRSETNLNLLCKKLQEKFPTAYIIGKKLDLASYTSIEDFYLDIKNSFPVEGIINNAAVDNTDSINEISYSSLDNLMKVNYLGPAYLTSLVLRKWRETLTPGSVVNISSLLAEFSAARSSAYAASKAALESYSKSIAYEYGDVGIRSNSIRIACMPGGLINEKEAHTIISFEENFINEKNDIQSIPLKRFGEFQEFVKPILFLLSQESSFITGQTLTIDGGTSIAYPGYNMPIPSGN